jgi:hypothetical protein
MRLTGLEGTQREMKEQITKIQGDLGEMGGAMRKQGSTVDLIHKMLLDAQEARLKDTPRLQINVDTEDARSIASSSALQVAPTETNADVVAAVTPGESIFIISGDRALRQLVASRAEVGGVPGYMVTAIKETRGKGAIAAGAATFVADVETFGTEMDALQELEARARSKRQKK